MRCEIVEAVLKHPCFSCAGDAAEQKMCAEDIATTVLRAALAGEPEGLWRAELSGNEWHVFCPTLTYRECREARYPRGPLYVGHSRTLALAVANALNLSRDLAAGGHDGA